MSSSSEAALSRTFTRILRDKGIDPSIKCTSTLVANYNAEEDANVRKAMRIWLNTHIEEFSKINPGSIPKKTITEFMNLAEIKVKEPDDAELVRRVYATVRHVVTQERKDCQIYYVLALEYILSTIDSNILQEDARSLVSLANCLIEMTDPQNGPLTRATFAYNASCLHAMERVLTVLHDLERHSSEKSSLVFFEDTVKKHLSKIISCQRYYPFAYQAFLFKENIKTLLEKDTKTLLINAGRRAFYAFCGGLYIFQGVRELAVMKLDFSAMESGIGKFREAFKDMGWYSMTDIQEIVSAASEAVEHDNFENFQQYCNINQNVSWWESMKWNKQRMIRYTLVSHLCLFCTEKHSRSNQDQALDLLIRLATKNEGKQWRHDEQIFEAMIEALIAVGKNNQEYRQPITNALHTIKHSQKAQHRRVIKSLLEGKTPIEIVKSDCALQQDDVGCTLFDCSRQALNLQRTDSIYERNQQILKDYYKNDSFAKVSLLADENDQRHIGSFDFNLEEYEEIVTFQGPRDQFSQENYNQRESNMQRSMRVKKTLDLKDLFKKRRMHPNRVVEDVQRVLVIGNPGTGKTCLSKRICSDWAIGEWGFEFEHVYLIPIRRLNDHRFGTDISLPIIIQKLIYQGARMQDTNQALYKEINDNLSESTTLLILDGYDEAGETAKTLVSSSLELECCLLILSRPHSLNAIRPRVEVEVECLEFNEKQLSNFICKVLGRIEDDANGLLEFLSQNALIRKTCCVAVNAEIITRLWKYAYYRAKLNELSGANITSFYSMISEYTWSRFAEQEDKFNKKLVFESLERIAFESFKEGLVEIPQGIVIHNSHEPLKVFRNSGFLLFVEEGSAFQFAHLTFHEYFAGCRLSKMLKSTKKEERHEAEKFISQHKYNESSRVMLSFMTQCYCMRDDMEANLKAFKDLMQVLESDPVPILSLQHLLLRMKTLDAFLPCGLDETKVHTNDVVMQIVSDATDALKTWFGYELDGDDRGRRVVIDQEELRTPIVDELERMPSLFNRFADLLKPVLLNDLANLTPNEDYRFDIARIGKLNPQYAHQCIVPLLDSWTMKKQAAMIQLCALIGPMCAEPTLDHLKKLLEDQDDATREMANRSLVKFLELFPKREDVRQLVVNASRDLNVNISHPLVCDLGYITFTPEDEAGTFVWDLLNEAMKDDDPDVRGLALRSCVRLYQTCGKSVDEVMELIREFVASSDFNNDLTYAAYAIDDLIQNVPEKAEEELLALMKEICKDFSKFVRSQSVRSLLRIIKRSCLKRDVLFNVAFDVFKDGYPEVQLKLLPFLFSFDKKEEDGIDEVNEWIANCQDLDEEVRKIANSCREANALLSNYTIEELNDKFYDQDKEVQIEVVAQFDLREMESTKAAGAIAEMAVHCLEYDRWFVNSKSLLEELSKTTLFSKTFLKKFAEERDGQFIQQQPLSHLFEYYWSTEDANMIIYIAEKLLLSAVIFERKGEEEMAITFREKGANVKQTAPFEVVQDMLTQCKQYLNGKYGLDFPHDQDSTFLQRV